MADVIVVESEENSLADVPKSIDHYMPQIFWHDRKQIMCVHIQQIAPPEQYISEEGKTGELCYKICTASVQHEVRVWELVFSKSKQPGFEQHYELGVNFVANLIGHTTTLNVAQYSPDGMCALYWKFITTKSHFYLIAFKLKN